MKLTINAPDGMPWDESTLHAMGASSIKSLQDGLEVHPDISLTDYEEAAKKKDGPHWGGLRTRRNNLLAGCDWTQLPDASLSKEEVQAWTDYRKALRDLPANTERVSMITWPKAPA